MAGLSFIHDYKSVFRDLSAHEKEELFALSCCEDSSSWEEGPSRLPEGFEIEDRIEEYLKRMKTGKWNAIKRNGDIRTFQKHFFGGRAANDILSWYLEDEYPSMQCKTESNNNKPQFDVMIYDQGITPVCSIELKRLVTTKQIREYLEDYPEDCEQRDDFEAHLFVNLYPTNTSETANTAFDLVQGYGRLSPCIHEFYDEENVFVANVPAPLEQPAEIKPLRIIYRLIHDKLNFE